MFSLITTRHLSPVVQKQFGSIQLTSILPLKWVSFFQGHPLNRGFLFRFLYHQKRGRSLAQTNTQLLFSCPKSQAAVGARVLAMVFVGLSLFKPNLTRGPHPIPVSGVLLQPRAPRAHLEASGDSGTRPGPSSRVSGPVQTTWIASSLPRNWACF